MNSKVSLQNIWKWNDKHFRAVFLAVFRKKAALHNIFIKKDDATMKRRKRRLNPIYWIFQYLGGLVAIGSLFFIPYLVEKILGGC